MSKDTITIKLNAEIDNMDIIEKQIEELQEKLSNMKVNLTIKEDDIEEKEFETIESIVESQVDRIKKEIENHNMESDGKYYHYSGYKENINDFKMFFKLLVDVYDYNIPSIILEDTAIFIDKQASKAYLLLRKITDATERANLSKSLIYLVDVKKELNRLSRVNASNVR